MFIEYRDCAICGMHIGEVDKDTEGHSKLTYYGNADILTSARLDKTYCKECAKKL